MLLILILFIGQVVSSSNNVRTTATLLGNLPATGGTISFILVNGYPTVIYGLAAYVVLIYGFISLSSH